MLNSLWVKEGGVQKQGRIYHKLMTTKTPLRATQLATTVYVLALLGDRVSLVLFPRIPHAKSHVFGCKIADVAVQDPDDVDYQRMSS